MRLKITPDHTRNTLNRHGTEARHQLLAHTVPKVIELVARCYGPQVRCTLDDEPAEQHLDKMLLVGFRHHLLAHETNYRPRQRYRGEISCKLSRRSAAPREEPAHERWGIAHRCRLQYNSRGSLARKSVPYRSAGRCTDNQIRPHSECIRSQWHNGNRWTKGDPTGHAFEIPGIEFNGSEPMSR